MSDGYHIRIAQDGHEALFGLPILQQLYPHLDEDHFPKLAEERFHEGYHFALMLEGTGIVAIAGYRYGASFAWGDYLFVEELMTDEKIGGQEYISGMLGWLKEQALHHNCNSVRIDGGQERFAAKGIYAQAGFEDIGTAHCCKLKG